MKYWLIIRTSLLVTLTALLLAGNLHAGQERRDTLVFNVSTGGYPPYTIINEDGSVSGLMWDLLALFAEDQALDLVAHQTPPRRVDAFLIEGRLDVVMRAIEWTPEPERFLFTDPIVRTRDVLVSHRERPLDYTGEETLHGRRILAQLGFMYPIFDPLVENGLSERFDVQFEPELFRRLLDGRHFHAAIADEQVARWVIHRHNWQEHLHISKQAISEADYRFMFGPGHGALVDAFNLWLQEARRSGELDQILSDYQ